MLSFYYGMCGMCGMLWNVYIFVLAILISLAYSLSSDWLLAHNGGPMR